MKRKARTDANQTEIVKHFRDHGFYVLHVHQLKNCVDIMVSKGLVTAAVEIKDGSKVPSARKLTEGELKFKEEWRGLWYLCECEGDANKIMADMREYINLIKEP
jgi:Holliday junction resolvase